jgi:hypothetical protein
MTEPILLCIKIRENDIALTAISTDFYTEKSISASYRHYVIIYRRQQYLAILLLTSLFMKERILSHYKSRNIVLFWQ